MSLPADRLTADEIEEIMAERLAYYLDGKRLVAASFCADCASMCGEGACARHRPEPQCMFHDEDLDDAGRCAVCAAEDASIYADGLEPERDGVL